MDCKVRKPPNFFIIVCPSRQGESEKSLGFILIRVSAKVRIA
jgi:hypothetical protein